MAQLDQDLDNLMMAVRTKGGAAGLKICNIMAATAKVCSFGVRNSNSRSSLCNLISYYNLFHL